MFGEFSGIPKEAKYLIYAGILPAIAYGMFSTDIAYFLTHVQGLSDVFMGSLIMIIGLSSVVFSIPLGMISDRYGRKKMLIIGNIIASAVIAVFALTDNPSILVIAAFLSGISEASFATSSSAMMAEKAGDLKRTAVFSLNGVINGISFGLGGFAIPLTFFFSHIGFNDKDSHILLYVILASLSMLSTLIMLKITESRALKKSKNIKSFFPQKSKGVLFKYVLTGSIVAFGAGMFVPLMARWFYLAYGISDALSGPLLGTANILIGFATISAPYLAKRIGLVNSIVTTQAFSTLFMFTIPVSPTFLVASTLYIIRTFLMNMAGPLQQSMIMGLVAEDERGVASGISSALWRLPNSLSTGIGAWLLQNGLLAAPFYIATILYILSISLFWKFFKNIKLPEEKVTD
ncbi:MAG: MFS transporter [Candidatus Methanomethylicia archaeon]|nr:MFS transporter [Candidatus Methanomethylicia archaeon]